MSKAEVNGMTMSYTSTGAGSKPPMVLIHGFSDNGLCWGPVAEALEDSYDIVMPDMRGHGESSRAQENDSIDMAGDVAALIRKLNLRSPVICGHSMGAMITFELATRFPDIGRAYVLEDPPWWLHAPEPQGGAADADGRGGAGSAGGATSTGGASGEVRASDTGAGATNSGATVTTGRTAASGTAGATGDEVGASILDWATSLADKTYETLLEECRRDNPTWPDSLVQAMARAKKQLDQNIIRRLSAKIRGREDAWKAGLANLDKPLLLVTGDPEKGGIVTGEVVEAIRKINSNVRIATIPTSGHLIRFDDFEIFMGHLREFLGGL